MQHLTSHVWLKSALRILCALFYTRALISKLSAFSQTFAMPNSNRRRHDDASWRTDRPGRGIWDQRHATASRQTAALPRQQNEWYGGRAQGVTYITMAQPTVEQIHGEPIQGKIIMADERQLMNEEFWLQHPDIKFRIQCTHSTQHIPVHPLGREVAMCYVDARAGQNLAVTQQFEACIHQLDPWIRQGYDVVVHCRKSYHRAPIIVAKLMSHYTGHNGAAIYPPIEPID
jgi:hypothetical protein